jgi:AcrR family transcriptional regulator
MAKKTGAAGKGRVPLDRDRVLRAAMALADARGIEALSMRRLGRALDVEAMSLYNHVSNKDDILTGLVDTIVGDIEIPAGGEDWKEAMRKRAISMRRTFVRHPWALGLMESRRSVGPAALRYIETVLGILSRGGFTAASALRAFSILDSYAYGFVIQEKNLPSGSTAEAQESAELFLQQLPPGEHPHLEEVAGEAALNSGFDFEKEFEFGLDLLLEALESIRGKD